MYLSLGLRLGDLVIEGKTKKVFDLPELPGHVLLLSKDRITAGDGARAHDLVGKAAISNTTACKNFEFLNTVGKMSNCCDIGLIHLVNIQ